MAGTLILDDDLMVLQRKGDFDIKDEFYQEKFPGQFENIRIDTEIFHFSGEDLRFSTVEYVMDSGKFVKTAGDTMSGNLDIIVPIDGVGEDAAILGLRGNQTHTTNAYAGIDFTNNDSSSNKKQKIQAFSTSQSSTYVAHIKIGHTAITDNGDILLTDSLDSGSQRSLCTYKGGGVLRCLTIDGWDTGKHEIKAFDNKSKRFSWDLKGGSLFNEKEQELVRWDEKGISFKGDTKEIIRIWQSDGDHATYFGRIDDSKDMVNKEYVDDQNDLYIPLAGTKIGNDVTGIINFADTAALNILPNQELHFTADGFDKFGINSDGSHAYADLNLQDNKILNVADPNTNDNNDPDEKNAVPKRYIDSLVQGLQDQYNNIAEVTAPPGMINAYTGTSAPTGWLICNGASYKCGSFKKMHLALGGKEEDYINDPNAYFKLPNLSGRFLAQFGRLNNDNNKQPVGYGIRNYNNQTTSLPYKNRKTGNNSNQYTRMGGHSHSVTQQTIEYVFGANQFKIMANAWDSNHQHHLGEQGKSAAGSNSTGRFYAAQSGELKTQIDGEHKHTVSLNYNSGHSSKDAIHLGYTAQDKGYFYEDEFDEYTLPYAYTINWIIKHDDAVNA